MGPFKFDQVKNGTKFVQNYLYSYADITGVKYLWIVKSTAFNQQVSIPFSWETFRNIVSTRIAWHVSLILTNIWYSHDIFLCLKSIDCKKFTIKQYITVSRTFLYNAS